MKKRSPGLRQKELDLFPEECQLPLRSPDEGQPVAAQPEEYKAPGAVTDLKGKTVFVLDSHSLIYQVFHAIGEMTGPDGRAVNALYGFTRDLLDIFSRWKPDFLFAAFDFSDSTFRNEIYPDYKAHRDEMPEDLRAQIPEIQKLLRALAIPVLEFEGYEADDILATVARETTRLNGKCVLVTADKDCRQLITESVCLLNLRKGQKYGSAELLGDWEIRPDQVVDFQAMVGDTSDNVPGIPTIGPKTAAQLLNEFGDLNTILANCHLIKGKKGEVIRQSADLARLSQQLVRLDEHVPIDLDWEAGRLGGMDVAQAAAICEEAGFRALKERVEKLSPMVRPAEWTCRYLTVISEDELRQVFNRIREKGVFAFDTETTSTHPSWADLVGFSLGWEPGVAIYVPIRAPEGTSVFPLSSAISLLNEWFSDPNLLMVGQNLKYDLVVLRGLGVSVKCQLFDTMVADYLLNPGRTAHNMDDLALRFLNHRTIKIEQLIGKGKKQKLMSDVPIDAITQYAAEDADVPLRLYPVLSEMLQEQGLKSLFQELEMPLVAVLADMEFSGISVDTGELRELSSRFGIRLLELQRQIHSLAGKEFNVDSPKQLADVLFESLRLPVVKKTKLARSTDSEVLQELAERHELPRLMLEYRQLAKLKNTYADALLAQVNPRTGRVHTSFQQDVARTGRLSSKDPNLQNIPVRTEAGRQIRHAFIATSPNRVLVTADYSQIELRILAHYCEDPALIRAFSQDEDIHAVVASQVNNVSLGQVTEEMRRQAKVINFGIIYGQSPYGLARELGISAEDAAEFIRKYFERYPSVDQFLNHILDIAGRAHEVRTLLGRKRQIEGVRPVMANQVNRSRTMPERIAINTVIQGSAADLIKLAMLKVHSRLINEFPNCHLLLQIHDELVVECPLSDRQSIADLLRDEMSHALDLKVPLKISVEYGPNWAQTLPC